MMRNGKVALLPVEIREELNERLLAGEAGPSLLEWLNGLRVVRRVLKAHFGGADITLQNLSEWRQGGHVDWLETKDLEEKVATVRTRASDLDGVTPVSEGVAAVLAAELARMTVVRLREAPDTEAKWERLERLLKQLNQLRRGDHRAAWARIKEQEWQLKLTVRAEEKAVQENDMEFKRQWVLPVMRDIEMDRRKMRREREEREAAQKQEEAARQEAAESEGE